MNNIHLELIKKYFSYDPYTGEVLWKLRHFSDFNHAKNPIGATNAWNARHAYKKAGYLDKINGYIAIRFLGTTFNAHVIAWVLMKEEIPIQIDHINGKRHDNRWKNLRNVSHIENHKNVSLKSGKILPIGVTHDILKRKNKNGTIKYYEYYKIHIKGLDGKCIRKSFSINLLGQERALELATEKSKEIYHLLGYHENHGRSANA